MNPSPTIPTTTTYSIPSGSESQNIMLDPSIRDWVVLPLLFIMILAGLIRHYLTIVFRPSTLKKVPYIEHRVKNTLNRASRLHSVASGFISYSKWEARRMYWTDKERGYLKEEMDWIEEEEEYRESMKKENGESANDNGDNDADMPDPMAMLGGMKGSMVSMVQNMVMMQGIGYFFQGYVLVKVPIPLTQGFKLMFQRGLDLSTLDTSYVSSVSWYFLVMYGLRAFFRLAIGDGDMGSQVGQESFTKQSEFGHDMNQAPGMPNKFDGKKFIKAVYENLELSRYRGTVDDAERRLLGKKYSRKKVISASGSGSGPGYDIYGVKANAKNSTSSKLKST